MKTAELSGRALDWAVERAKGTHWSENGYFCFTSPARYDNKNEWYDANPEWAYSSCSAGDDIIDRERLATLYSVRDLCWYADHGDRVILGVFRGATRREAAMRYFVWANLGDDVDIPEALC